MPSSAGSWSMSPVASSTAARERLRRGSRRAAGDGSMGSSRKRRSDTSQLLTGLASKVCRRDAVTADEVVHVTGRRVAARPAVGNQHPLARAPERQGRLEPSRPAADDQHVEEFIGHVRNVAQAAPGTGDARGCERSGRTATLAR